MTITLYHHPYTRASSVVTMLEAVDQPYRLVPVDYDGGEHKSGVIAKHNPMGKIPVLTDDDLVMTEGAAIGLYLADRYAPGRLAPALDDPRRGAYYRWALFGPSVIEPATMAARAKWDVDASAAGWGTLKDVERTIEHLLSMTTSWVLGDMFSMADIIFGTTVRYMRQVGTLDPSTAIDAYLAKFVEHPAVVASDAVNGKAAAAISGSNGETSS